MESDSSYLNCTTNLEWINIQGLTTKKANYKLAGLRLIRNNLRQMFIEVRDNKSNTTVKLVLQNINIFNKFMHEGKATIKLNEERCTILLSNAPSAQLIAFLKTIFIKMTHQMEKKLKNPSKHVLTSVYSSSAQDISPVITCEINNAKEHALRSVVSRKTITTSSPSNVRKRKLCSNPTIIELFDEQKQVLDIVLSGKNIFFTGSAGTGKSFLLKRIIDELPPDLVTVTASTGVAACQIGGITLHQFCGIGLGIGTLERCYQLACRPATASVWRKTKYLIIDEISMVDGEFFDKIEAVARYIRKNDKPFGGIQLILCGDFFQLPPVIKNGTKNMFCFESKSWKNCIDYNFELETIHRQKDPMFIKILNSIRIGQVTEEISTVLKSTVKHKIEKDGILATRLCSHVREADTINTSQLNNLKGPSKTYIAQDSDQSMAYILNQLLSVPDQLTLKVGAQVMLLKNINLSSGLVNGARGVVLRFENDTPIVQYCTGEIHYAKMEKWTIKTATGRFIHRKQVPLKLAWAFSIHKSQGLTLDCVEMSLAKVFDAGQAYVALSRAQSLECLRVLDFTEQQVWANPCVLEFYKKFRKVLYNMKIISIQKNKWSF
ncbi:hypothetical protein PV328_004083 [Microctonus aethiopoides]|uniref:ATP-dependent DNA helicase PIF1 n=1 Tax=Microctonus aethiopoides TaxID=144406 RepID=A0AA39KL89_9HYME|nr:hypothetical protein PV328_004083 [Microctonus aethiopoides]